jgi:hypothetical protein
MSSALLEHVCLKSNLNDSDVMCTCYVALQRALMFAYGFSTSPFSIVMGVTVTLREWSLAGYKQTISPFSRRRLRGIGLSLGLT